MRFLWQKHRMPSINSTAPNKMISIKTAEQTLPLIYAPVTELVDMRDLGSRAVMRVGSSPTRRTTSEQALIACSDFLCNEPPQFDLLNMQFP